MSQNILKGRSNQDTFIDLDIKNGKLIIKNLETSDNDIIEYFSKQNPALRQDRLITALRLGVVSLNSNQISDRTDYVDRKFDQMCNKVISTIEEIQNLHENNLGEDGTLQKVIDAKLLDLKHAMNIKSAEDDIKNKTSLKGADFEKICLEILSTAAKINGDLLEDTTEVTGKIKGCKKGDYTLTLSESKKKITFDAKNVREISTSKIKEVLEGAIENREASYGILIVKSPEAIPKSIGAFNEIGDNMLVCAIGNGDEVTIHEELLIMALRYAKIRIISQSVNNKHVDASVIQEKIGSIRQKIGKLRTSKADCTNIEKSTKNIRNNLESLEYEINRDLDSVDRSLEIRNES